MILPMQYKDNIRLHRIDTYDEYRMLYDYLLEQYRRKKDGKFVSGWQIARGKIPMGIFSANKMGIIS